MRINPETWEFTPSSICSIEGWGALIAGGAVLGAVGSVVAGGEQASGQKAAANTQANELSSIQNLENPFVQAGYGATTSLTNLLNGTAGGTDSGTGLPNGYLTQEFSPTQKQLEQYPGYQFSLNTGAQSVGNANAAGGSALSGPAMKQLASFNQGTANTYYGNYFNQFQTQQNNIFDRLSGIAQLGQAAAGGVASAGTQLGTGIAQAQAGAAASQAGGIVGATNSLGSSIPLAYLLGGQSSANPYGSGAAAAADNPGVLGTNEYGVGNTVGGYNVDLSGGLGG